MRMNRTSKNPFVRAVEAIAYREREIRMAVQIRREEIASEVSGKNPTADNAIYLSEGIISVVLPDGQEVERPEIWLEAFDNARAVCQSVGQLDELEILKARYGRGRRGGEHQNATCERLHISPTSYQRKLDNLRYILTIAAVEKGLIRISPK